MYDSCILQVEIYNMKNTIITTLTIAFLAIFVALPQQVSAQSLSTIQVTFAPEKDNYGKFYSGHSTLRLSHPIWGAFAGAVAYDKTTTVSVGRKNDAGSYRTIVSRDLLTAEIYFDAVRPFEVKYVDEDYLEDFGVRPVCDLGIMGAINVQNMEMYWSPLVRLGGMFAIPGTIGIGVIALGTAPLGRNSGLTGDVRIGIYSQF